MEKNEIKHIQRLIEAGSNIAGATTGAAIGFILGDIQGAVIGGASGGFITGAVKTLGDITYRSLSNREENRIGAAASFAIDKIRTKLEAGEIPRDDGFFQERESDSRSDAEEIFEGALLKSKNEHEERKIRIIANIFAYTAFYSEINTSEANHILQVAENMTYRQMCMLAIFERKAEYGKQNFEGISLATKDTSQDADGENEPIIKEISALQEIYQLYNLGLVARIYVDSVNADGFSDSAILSNHNYFALLTFDDVVPDQMALTNLGKRYYSIMDLAEIPKEDLLKVAITLSR